jgi:hypothetical protein
MYLGPAGWQWPRCDCVNHMKLMMLLGGIKASPRLSASLSGYYVEPQPKMFPGMDVWSVAGRGTLTTRG